MPAKALNTTEWGKAEQIEAQFGFTRGTLHKLASNGRIKSALVKTRDGARKGVRLYSIESIRALLEASLQ